MELRKCYTCKEYKDLESFHKKPKEPLGRSYQCSLCKKIENYRRRYNITIDDYNTLFNQQGGRCKICTKHQSDLKSILVVDHDHKEGHVRGLLCARCNQAIGLIDEDVSILEGAIIYLKGLRHAIH